jgi:holliday junction DNA helicase RuvA
MFDYITGKLTKITQECAIVEANGIGYKMFVATSTLTKLPACGATVRLFTSFVVREFSHTFYGFLEDHERELFEALLNISGIGPKTSLAIIGHLSIDELVQAQLTKDTKTLCKVPGIGKKTAERLLVELKDTLAQFTSHASLQNQGQTASPKMGISYDAISALMNLGYSQQIAQMAVKKALTSTSEPENLETLITLSLQNMR